MFLYIGQCHNNSFDNLKYKPLACKNNIAMTFPFCWLVTFKSQILLSFQNIKKCIQYIYM